MFKTFILMALCALLAAIVLPVAIREWKGIVRSSAGFSRRSQIRLFVRRVFAPAYYALDRFMSWTQRLASAIANRKSPIGNAVPLANTLGMINDNGIESLIVDPASVNLPFPGRYLLIMRGASGYQYGDLCSGGAAGPLPLGPSSDSPYQTGDILNVRRLGCRKGLEIGIGVAGKTVTIDKLLVAAAAGTVQDVTTLTVNGTYWVVGRAAATIPSTGSLMEVPYVPCVPWQIINTGGTLTVPANPV
jgi:hypothetical protein